MPMLLYVSVCPYCFRNINVSTVKLTGVNNVMRVLFFLVYLRVLELLR